MARWHELKGREMANEVADIANDLYQKQSQRRSRYLRNQQLYERVALSSYGAAGYYTADHLGGVDGDKLGLIRSAVQTGHAEIYAKQKPKPQFQTSGAEWKLCRKAQKLDKVCEGTLAQASRWSK